jgi:hypothetical protein
VVGSRPDFGTVRFDPAASIASRVGYYWTRRLQAAFIATMKGVFANNASGAPGGGAVRTTSPTTFPAAATSRASPTSTRRPSLDAVLTIGDSMQDLSLMMVHSVVYGRMQKNNLIDFIPDARGEVMIPVYQGKQVIVDDGMPKTGTVYDTWIFGAGAVRLGVGAPIVPTETFRHPFAGNGGGQSTLYNRVEWTCIRLATSTLARPDNGGPTIRPARTTLPRPHSWQRVYPERKQIKIARLITREA